MTGTLHPTITRIPKPELQKRSPSVFRMLGVWSSFRPVTVRLQLAIAKYRCALPSPSSLSTKSCFCSTCLLSLLGCVAPDGLGWPSRCTEYRARLSNRTGRWGQLRLERCLHLKWGIARQKRCRYARAVHRGC